MGQEYQNQNSSIFRNQITKIDLQTVVVNPTLAFKVNEYLNVGFGIDWMYAKAKLNKTPVNVGIGDNTTGGNSNSIRARLRRMATPGDTTSDSSSIPSKNIKVGFNYRSPFTMKLKDGDVDLSGISTAGRAALGGASVSQTFFGGATSYHTNGSTTIKMPATFALGVSYTYGQADGGGGRGLDVLAQLQQPADRHRRTRYRPCSRLDEYPEELEGRLSRSGSGRNTG